MARRLTNREQITEYQKIVKSLRPRQWTKYMRFLGLSDHDLENISEKYDQHQILCHWQQKMGILTENIIVLLNDVAKEVKSMERNLNLDAKFQTKLAQNRDRAWLLYGPVHFYTNIGNWRSEIVRTKLNVTEADVAQIEGFAEKDLEEQKYQHLLIWIQKEGFVNTIEIARELTRLEIVVPDEFWTPGVAVER